MRSELAALRARTSELEAQLEAAGLSVDEGVFPEEASGTNLFDNLAESVE